MSNLNIPEMVLDLDLSEANPNLNLPLDLPTPTINSVPPLPLVTDPDANSVCVSIEPNHECEIFEMKYDGQEIYKELVLLMFLLLIKPLFTILDK